MLMCGTGVGFSVERNFINKLPEIAETFHKTDSVIVVSDSKIGWASSFRELNRYAVRRQDTTVGCMSSSSWCWCYV